jgi:tetratricopeptide (TPR) repeat protein
MAGRPEHSTLLPQTLPMKMCKFPGLPSHSPWLLSVLMLTVLLPTLGCKKTKRDQSDALAQRLEAAQTKTDDLRKAMRYLKQMNPVNSRNMSQEVQKGLSSWLKVTPLNNERYTPANLLQGLPKEALDAVGCSNPVELKFSLWDIDYLYECQMARDLSNWIVAFPIRDSLLAPSIAAKAEGLSVENALRLEEAYKLFDWTIRNIALEAEPSSQVTAMISDPRLPLSDEGIGYGYLPWETLLFGRGDFIERGRVFTALARQRGIDTFWISVGAEAGRAGKLFAIGMLLGDEILIFEPKLGLPLLDPDTLKLATFTETQANERILRRLDLAGQFDYAFEASMMNKYQLLIDAPPTAASARMKLLASALLGDERMNVYVDLDSLEGALKRVAPDASVELWQTPLLAQIQAASIRERLRDTTPFSLQYMARHGVWLYPTPASQGRLKHLSGQFENTFDVRGALGTYMDSRVDDESIAKLRYDPAVQKELDVIKNPSETREQYDMRIQQAQFIYGRAKLDVSFALGQLHFDRGNYSSAEKWFRDRVVGDDRAADLHAAAWYTLGRAYQEQGKMEQAAAAFTQQPSPQEAGNRLRLRYLRSVKRDLFESAEG